jgi:hypothetical protein
MRWIVVGVFMLLFLALPVLADGACEYKVNLGDSDFEQRAGASTTRLLSYYSDHFSELNSASESYLMRYPAALFFAEGNSPMMNQFLHNEFENQEDLAPVHYVYLAWIDALQDAGRTSLDPTVATPLGNHLDSIQSYTPGSDSDAEYIPKLIAQYIAHGGSTSQLRGKLKARGTSGWESIPDVRASADIVASLGALFYWARERGDYNLMTLAEMSLDVFFARYAVLVAGGFPAGVASGATASSGILNPKYSPWLGWEYLYLDADTYGGSQTNYNTFTEPALLMSGYKTNTALIGLREKRQTSDGTTWDATTTRDALFFSHSMENFIMGGTFDVEYNYDIASIETFEADPEGYVIRGSVRFPGNPELFMLLSTHVSDDVTDTMESYTGDQEALGNVVAHEGFILGELGRDDCREPHLLVSGLEGGNSMETVQTTSGDTCPRACEDDSDCCDCHYDPRCSFHSSCGDLEDFLDDCDGESGPGCTLTCTDSDESCCECQADDACDPHDDCTQGQLNNCDELPEDGCGDGEIDTGEDCDLGTDNGVCPAVCSDECEVNECGAASTNFVVAFVPVDWSGSLDNEYYEQIEIHKNVFIESTNLDDCPAKFGFEVVTTKCNVGLPSTASACRTQSEIDNAMTKIKACATAAGIYPDYWAGILNSNKCGGYAGLNYLTTNVQWAETTDSTYNAVTAHELGHSFGLNDEYFDACNGCGQAIDVTHNCLKDEHDGDDSYEGSFPGACGSPGGGFESCAPGMDNEITCMGNKADNGRRGIMSYVGIQGEREFCPESRSVLDAHPRLQC